MDIRRQFDAIGPRSAEGNSLFFGARQDWARAFINEQLGDICEKAILDLGCGQGDDLAAYGERGAIAFGVDASQVMVAAAQAHGQRAAVGYLEALPFRDAQFDAAVSRLGFHYSPEFDEAYAECARVLKPNGRLIVVGPHPYCEAIRHDGYRNPKVIENKLFDGAVTVRYPTHTLAQWLSPAFCEYFALEAIAEYAGEGENRLIEPNTLALAARKLEAQKGFNLMLLLQPFRVEKP